MDLRPPSILCTHEKMERCVHANDASYFSAEHSGPFRYFLQLENHHSLPDSDPESGFGPLTSPVRRSKRVKVEILNTEGTASCGGDDEDLPGLATKTPMGKGKCKAARPPPVRTPLSESAASPKKPKQSSRLSRSPTPHLRTGGKRMTPSRRCARGSPRQWTQWVVTRPSGRRWILGCVTHIISSNPLLFN